MGKSEDIELQQPPRQTADAACDATSDCLDLKEAPFSKNTLDVSCVNAADLDIQERSLESQNRESAVALPPADGGVQAWSFLAFAFILEGITWGLIFSYGIFQDYYTHNPPFNTSSETAIAAVGTVSLALQYMGLIFMVTILERWPHIRKGVMWASLALCCGSLVVASFATKVAHLIITQGILFGLGGAALYAAVLILFSEWFVRRRSLAGSIMFGGSGLGGAIFPILLNILLQKMGWRWTLRIWALGTAIPGGIAVWCVKGRIPIVKNQPSQVKPVSLSFLRAPLFIAISATLFIQAIAYFPVSLYMPTYTTALGFSIVDGTLSLTVFNLASTTGQLIFGHICDRAPYIRVMVFSAAGSALSAYLLWGFGHSLSLVFLFVIIFGGLGGGFFAIGPAASTDVAGTEHSNSVIFGAFLLVKGFAVILGPILATRLHDPHALIIPGSARNFGGYGFTTVTLFVGGMMVAATAGSIVSMGVRRWVPKT
ncbi:hypothetical protein BOTBODRAFT_27484 [Botryobasidium botryosum FD-172 SS1]|uniref:Major facilitator superfamily (MFS) profile domain-containing protein n=1 Tax=Botryobasidium botryosum (strain FD-172 SS1) TaxID=930990 RepID=A0A067MWS0_BOTB1|nr:hypothetical protein BOTBODRAFT_27484 [Botryobasidium botryosum FD-172 SS1]